MNKVEKILQKIDLEISSKNVLNHGLMGGNFGALLYQLSRKFDKKK